MKIWIAKIVELIVKSYLELNKKYCKILFWKHVVTTRFIWILNIYYQFVIIHYSFVIRRRKVSLISNLHDYTFSFKESSRRTFITKD